MPDCCLDLTEQRVHPHEVVVFGRAVGQLELQLPTRRNERHRKVAIDVRVHAGQCELEWCDAAARLLLEQRHPCGWSTRRVALVRVVRGKKQIGKADIKAFEKLRICEISRRELRVHTLGHLAIEASEASNAVRAGGAASIARNRAITSGTLDADRTVTTDTPYDDPARGSSRLELHKAAVTCVGTDDRLREFQPNRTTLASRRPDGVPARDAPAIDGHSESDRRQGGDEPAYTE